MSLLTNSVNFMIYDTEKDDSPEEDFPVPKTFAGNHLPFVG